eukprot:gnl/Hemi2/20782_TR6882_c0_g1_i1.p1 gnl/Hemi2/20782_TR6882_c0_g1~~gnl/Hemi2/20782_TR6882_c0_g1_i1.p1  ORF type:complete len:295 (-),score=45.51 gnl/Hemi2/20782_TR6882_c0_g1_i1:218-1102(-)
MGICRMGQCSPGVNPSAYQAPAEMVGRDALALIFSGLKNAADLTAVSSVCKKWRDVVIAYKLWRHLDFSTDRKDLQDDRVLSLPSSLCGQLEIVSFAYCCNITDQAIVYLVERCPNLLSFNLFRCSSITEDSLIAIARHCPLLDTLDLGFNSEVTDAALQTLARGCPNLRHLKLAYCCSFTDNGIQAVAEHCTGLVTLDITHSHITNSSLLAVAEHCPHIRTLGLCYCNSVTDVGVVCIAQKCKNITTLDLRFCENIGEMSISLLIRMLPMLQSVQYMVPSWEDQQQRQEYEQF